jgi:hypothetical protein
MTTHEFDNQASQAERREVLRNDTYFARQSNTVDDAGGRYAKLTPSNVIGSATSPQYPQQPENSPWHHDPVAATEPLGFSVDAMEPVGTHAEVQASIEPALIPQVAASPTTEVDRTGERSAAAVVSFPAATAAAGSSIKRRSW